MKARLFPIIKFALILLVVLGSVAFFGYELYRNMGKGSKAAATASATITLTNSATGTIPAGSTFTVGVGIDGKADKLSAIDLFFNDPQKALDFVMPDASFPLEDQGSKAFDETVMLKTERNSPSSTQDTSQKITRLVMVSKRPTGDLRTNTIIRLRFKARRAIELSYPSAVSFSVDTKSSKIAGPGSGNSFNLTPDNPSLPITLGCAGSQACGTDSVCFDSICRLACGAGNSCNGHYYCWLGACLPGDPPNSSSSSSTSYGLGPSITPAPSAHPDKANLYFKVKIPDILPGIGVAPQVRVLLREGYNPVAKTYLTLYRQGDYFRTNAPLEFDIPAGAARQYTILVKQQKSIQRSFTVTLQRGTTADCTTVATTCGGSLQNPDQAPLLGGDSDGFLDGTDGASASASFNKVDTTDLQRMVDGYGVIPLPAEPNADFNLDGKIDILDLGILGKNYGKAGE